MFLALCLAGCATAPVPPASAIVRLQRGHQAARAVAALFRPYLSPAQAARIDALDRLVDRALAVAGGTADRAALAEAAAAVDAYRLATGG